MEILLKTIAEKANYCISRIYLDGVYFCDSIEDTVRDLSKVAKVPGKTAIPSGRYRVTLNVVSPRFHTSQFYKTYANGARIPRLLNVPYFDGVLIHCGSTEANSAGCIIVGKNKVKGCVSDSKETFKKLYAALKKADEAKEQIHITIKRISY